MSQVENHFTVRLAKQWDVICGISALGGFQVPAWQASVSKFVGRSDPAVGQRGGPFQIPSRPIFHVLVFLFHLLSHLEFLLHRGSSGLWDFCVSRMTLGVLTGSSVLVFGWIRAAEIPGLFVDAEKHCVQILSW